MNPRFNEHIWSVPSDSLNRGSTVILNSGAQLHLYLPFSPWGPAGPCEPVHQTQRIQSNYST